MSVTPDYAWRIRGLGGCVNMLEQMVRDHAPIEDHWRKELERELIRLNALNNFYRLGVNLPALVLVAEGMPEDANRAKPPA